MFDEKELSNVFGKSDEKFRNNFDNVLTELQTKERPRRVRKARSKVAAIILAACAILAVTVYAAERIFVDRADIGASWVLVSAPDDYYESISANMLRLIYSSELTDEKQPRVDAATAQILSDLLADKVFDEGGSPVEIMAQIPETDEYHASAADALYNIDGEELREIRYETVGYSEPLDIEFQTKESYEQRREQEREGIYGDSLDIKLTDDYEEAARLLGSDFRLPGIYTEGLSAPEYRYQKSKDGEDAGRKAVYVTYRGNPGMYYFAEATRGDGETYHEWFADGALIEQCEIDGTEVYKATSAEIIRYAWTCDGVVYMLFQDYSPDEFTDEQFVEIIESMIR